MYIFAIGGFFASQTRRYGFILRGTLVDISRRGDTAYSNEVVLVIVHNLFLGILGVSAFVRRDTALRRSLLNVFC